MEPAFEEYELSGHNSSLHVPLCTVWKDQLRCFRSNMLAIKKVSKIWLGSAGEFPWPGMVNLEETDIILYNCITKV